MKIKIEPFNDDELPSERASFVANAVICVESVFYAGEYSYYPLTFLEKCTCKVLD